jgi:hypothetical protein
MKLLVRQFKLSNLSLLIRNTLKINPVDVVTFNIKKSSISDAFAWRTDNGYKTIFKFSDVLNLFYKIKKSKINIEFYNKENKFIKKIKISSLKLSNQLLIDKKFFNGLESFGVFYVYHQANIGFDSEDSISNRCYLGYSLNNNLFSFVHGNTLSKHKPINSSNLTTNTDPVQMSLLKNQNYKIQKYFFDYDKNELMFCNPTRFNIDFDIDNKKYFLKKGCSQILTFKNTTTINIKSNCMFLRPTIFSYKDKFIDVHHG